ncbi:small nuclear ribonucleoprotein [Oceanobacillus longus]|uniref:Small nuclear ribonucleoprotein n=1 Tax=Oceanobacillus longus TaxID=930120 RepID=A0ABV8GWY4_9BACI
MNTENNVEYHNDLRNLHDECQRLMNHHVTLSMADGSAMEGIIENVDRDHIDVLVGEEVMERDSENESDNRQFYGGGYGRPRRSFRRFRRRRFPLASLAALALLPYIVPTPYPYYPYPYY